MKKAFNTNLISGNPSYLLVTQEQIRIPEQGTNYPAYYKTFHKNAFFESESDLKEALQKLDKVFSFSIFKVERLSVFEEVTVQVVSS